MRGSMHAMSTPSNEIWTVPNALTFLRLAILPLFLWLGLAQDELGWTFLVGGVGFVTDLADGRIARATGKITKLGIILDPLADRLALASGVAVILVHDLAWGPLVWFVVIRDVSLVVAGAIFVKVTGRQVPPVSWIGKRASFAVSAGLGAFILAGALGTPTEPEPIIQTVAYVVASVGAIGYLISTIGYVRAAFETPAGS